MEEFVCLYKWSHLQVASPCTVSFKSCSFPLLWHWCGSVFFVPLFLFIYDKQIIHKCPKRPLPQLVKKMWKNLFEGRQLDSNATFLQNSCPKLVMTSNDCDSIYLPLLVRCKLGHHWLQICPHTMTVSVELIV